MTFHEYPKWITPQGKKPMIVKSVEEEREMMGHTDTQNPAKTETQELRLSPEEAEKSMDVEFNGNEKPDTEDTDDKDALIAQAKALGIPAGKNWGIPKLKAAIEAA